MRKRLRAKTGDGPTELPQDGRDTSVGVNYVSLSGESSMRAETRSVGRLRESGG